MIKKVWLPLVIGGGMGMVVAHKIPLGREDTVIAYDEVGYKKLDSVNQVCALFPKTAKEVQDRSAAAQKKALKAIEEFVNRLPKDYNKQTVLVAFDVLRSLVASEFSIFSLMKSVSTDTQLVAAAEKEVISLNHFVLEQIESNKQIYCVIKTYAEGKAVQERLSEEDRYFLKKMVETFELQGLNLSAEKQSQILTLKKRCAELESEFSRNIDQDGTTLRLPEEALAGVSDDFKKSLTCEEGLYVLHLDYPTRSAILSDCTVEETRKQFYKAFHNKGYPANETVLQELIKDRDQCAVLLGFESFAAYDLVQQMIQTPERAWNFEKDLQGRARVVADRDFRELVSDLPKEVSLSLENKMNPWDYEFVVAHFKKRHYAIDERHFAEYFPMEKTISGLIKIYEQFLSVSIKPIPVRDLWCDDVQLLEVKDPAGKVLGYVFLDMFPRPNKYGHAAAFEASFAFEKADGSRSPGVVTLVCNFTKPTASKPSLLKYEEVTTFFHEFGHAMHLILGATNYAALSGFNTETDFVELPSQMLENWMEDKEMLKSISLHYLSGESLPDDLIDQRLRLLKFGQGLFVTRQLHYGMVSLEFFGPCQDKSLGSIYKRLAEENCPNFAYDDDTHAYCSFGHLVGYGAKYYGYLWSLALAYDVFEQIEKEGLLNPEAGKKYVDAILSKGGSRDANDMVHAYLGREPQFDAFYRKMGL